MYFALLIDLIFILPYYFWTNFPLKYDQIVLFKCAIPVDEDVDVVVDDFVDLVLHLFLLGHLEISDLGHGVDSHTRTKDLDFVSVHGSVGDQNACLFNALGLMQTRFLVQKET